MEKRISLVEQEAQSHYSKDYYKECKDAWAALELRIQRVEVIEGIYEPKAGKNLMRDIK